MTARLPEAASGPKRWATCGFPVDRRATVGDNEEILRTTLGTPQKALDQPRGRAHGDPCQVARAVGHRAKQAPGLEVSGSHRPARTVGPARRLGRSIGLMPVPNSGAPASGWGAGFGPVVRIVSPRPWVGRAHRTGLAPRSRPARAGRLLGATYRFGPGPATSPTPLASCATLTDGSTKPLSRGAARVGSAVVHP